MTEWFYVEHRQGFKATQRLVFKTRQAVGSYVHRQLNGKMHPSTKEMMRLFLEGTHNGTRVFCGDFRGYRHDFEIYPLTEPPHG